MEKKKQLIFIITIIIILHGCIPQAYYFNVDEKSQNETILPDAITDIAIFPIIKSNPGDSSATVMTAFGVAEKLEHDRNLNKESINVYTLSIDEFTEQLRKSRREYSKELFIKTGAENQIYLYDLKFGKAVIKEQEYSKTLDIYMIEIPYNLNIHIYNTIKDSTLYENILRGIINIQADGKTVRSKEINSQIYKALPEISKNLGEQTAKLLSPQWVTKEKILIYYPDSNWKNAIQLATDFRFEEAIKIWMELSKNQSYKKSSYAAYNIATAFEILENYTLCQEWINFGLRKYPFKELELLRRNIKGIMDEQKSSN